MTTSYTSRIGTAPEEGIKAPVVTATTENITLSGLQTIDGVALANANRLLVKDQTMAAENGIYLAASGDWIRATDFNGSDDVTKGQLIVNINDGTTYKVNVSGSWIVGTTSITFDLDADAAAAAASAAAASADAAAATASAATASAADAAAATSAATASAAAATASADVGVTGIHVAGITALAALNVSNYTTAYLESFHDTLDVGGGNVYYDPNVLRSAHNGVTIFDLTTRVLGSWDSAAQVAWFASGGSGTGCWIRVGTKGLGLEHAGGKKGGTSDCTLSARALITLNNFIGLDKGVWLIDPSVRIDLINGSTIIGTGLYDCALLAKYDTAGSVIGRDFNPVATNDRVDDVRMMDFSIFLNHIHQSSAPANIQVGFDMRNIGRTNIHRCYAGNYRWGVAKTLFPNAGTKAQACRGYPFAYGNVGGGDIAYAGGEVHRNVNCKSWWGLTGIAIDEVALSPVSAAYNTQIIGADIQTVARGISQQSRFGTGCRYTGNLIQDIQQPAGSSETLDVYHIAGYENTISDGYVETHDTSIDHVVHFLSTARNNVVTPFYYDNSKAKFLNDEGSRNVVEFYTVEAGDITGATAANPVVITSVGHNLRNGETIIISDVVGMTELNNNPYTISNLTADTYELTGIDGTSFTAYTSGGITSVVDKFYNKYLYNAPIEETVKFNWDGLVILAKGRLASASNITRTGVGDYSIVFNTPYLLDNYTISVTLDTNASGHAGTYSILSHSTANIRLLTYGQNAGTTTQLDPRNIWLTIRQNEG